MNNKDRENLRTAFRHAHLVFLWIPLCILLFLSCRITRNQQIIPTTDVVIERPIKNGNVTVSLIDTNLIFQNKFVKRAVPIYQKTPQYPEIRRRAGIQGDIYLKILIDREGKVQDTKVIEGKGSGLSSICIEAAKKWQFIPAKLENYDVESWVVLKFEFRLNDNSEKK
jgi:TonB family protein